MVNDELINAIKNEIKCAQSNRLVQLIKYNWKDQRPYFASVTTPFVEGEPHLKDVTHIVKEKHELSVSDFLKEYVQDFTPRNKHEEELVENLKLHLNGIFEMVNQQSDLYRVVDYELTPDCLRIYKGGGPFYKISEEIKKIFIPKTIDSQLCNYLRLEICK